MSQEKQRKQQENEVVADIAIVLCEACDATMKNLCYLSNRQVCSLVLNYAKALYDAGYRKKEGKDDL